MPSVILSFDDGPGPVTALNSILKTLDTNGIKAEFYVLGNEVKQFPDGAKSIVSHGHKIQNHSWSHVDLAKATEATVQSELEKTQQIIKDTTGITPTKVRPPYGAGGWPKKYDPELAKVAKSLSLTIHNWDVDTEDWKPVKGIGPAKLKAIDEQLKKQVGKPTLDILMHVQEATAKDLPNFISHLKGLGFTFAKP